MSIERGPCQIMLKSEIFHFFAKKILKKKFEHIVCFVLKNAIIDENFFEQSQGVVRKRRLFVQ
jgi:hypothetical protein